MTLAITPERRALREALRDLLARACPPAAVLAAMETPDGTDRALWDVLSRELGLPGLLVPEDLGGAGLGLPELVVVQEELGRVLPCVPAFSTAVLAPLVLLHAAPASGAARDRLARIAAGGTTVAVALGDDPSRWGGGYGDVTAAPAGALTGWASYVPDGHIADVLLVTARDPGGATALYEVDAREAVRSVLPALDLTRPMAGIVLRDAPGRLLARGAGDGLARALDLALVALAAEHVGGARRCLDLGVRHAGTREQFGRPIGAFQGVKHLCADMLRAIEPACSAVRHAAACDPADLPEQAALVKAHCPGVHFAAACEAIQIHGALGFSWEHELHLHYKRAKSGQLLFGETGHHLDVVAARAGFGEDGR
ncbi:acyl-CoA dehydrogenase family protein [Actinomadura sp. WAC 06369]|uniref:acyl-CoA dehydrogenase family protein n=1 Tax=Actinomadura sp. WAC 06369 TaxID=2203193 RepID=UPI0018F4CBAD|nr:acyl-CoA dehydrogenase family protein [Actinomadura sp. WAC 06369]